MTNKLKRAADIGAKGLDAADDIYAKNIARPFILLVVLVIIGAVLNSAGLKEWNLGIAALVAVCGVIASLSPRFLLAVFVGGSAAKVAGFDTSGASSIKIYFDILKNSLIWVSFLFLVLGTRSFEGELALLFSFLFVTAMLIGMSHVWGMGSRLTKKFVFVYTSAVAIYITLLSIPPHIIGIDIRSLLDAPGYQSEIEEIRDLRDQREIEAVKSKLEAIKGKIERGEKLTDDEEAFLSEIGESSISRLISSLEVRRIDLTDMFRTSADVVPTDSSEDKRDYAQDRSPLVEEAQRLLSAQGYDVGVADGIMGSKTTEAVKAYQRDSDIEQDGEINNALRVRLQASGKTSASVSGNGGTREAIHSTVASKPFVTPVRETALFTGQIFQVTGPLASSIKVGDTISGSFDFNSAAVDGRSEDPNNSQYYGEGSPYNLRVKIADAGFTWEFNQCGADCVIYTTDSVPNSQEFMQQLLSVGVGAGGTLDGVKLADEARFWLSLRGNRGLLTGGTMVGSGEISSYTSGIFWVNQGEQNASAVKFMSDAFVAQRSNNTQ